ncbi:RCC1 domain-containing protein, partial [Burkholderia ubonensis]
KTVGQTLVFAVDARYISPNNNVTASYNVVRAASGKTDNAQDLQLAVGSKKTLPAPTVPEAVDGALPKDTPTAHVNVAPYTDMAAGDDVTVAWSGDQSGNYTPPDQTVSRKTVGQTLVFAVDARYISPNNNVTASYNVVRAASGKTDNAQDLQLAVGSKKTLPAPTVPASHDGKLSPSDVPTGAAVVIQPYDGMASGDTITLTWGNEQPVQPIIVTARMVGKPITFTVPLTTVQADVGQSISIFYHIDFINGDSEDSSPIVLEILKDELPAPIIDQAKDGTLDPSDLGPDGATARVPASAQLQTGDVVTLSLAGQAPWQVPHTVTAAESGKSITEQIPLSTIQSDVNTTVTLSYTITRTGSDPIPSPNTQYDIRNQIDPGRLLVMGARYKRSTYRDSDANRFLSVFNRDTLKPLKAAWQYQGRTDTTVGTTFKDIRPWLPLIVSSSDRQVTINPANICGTGTDASSQTAGTGAFTALLNEHNIIAWGDEAYGGNVPSTELTFDDIAEVSATQSAFSALRTNGRVATWGNASQGGSAVPDLTDAKYIAGNNSAFAALRTNGSVKAWGDATNGGTVSPEVAALVDITDVFPAGTAFAALRRTGQVVAWGAAASGGQVPSLISTFTDIVDLCGNYSAFVARRKNGSVVAWGVDSEGGAIPDSIAARRDIQELSSSNARAFAVRTNSNQVLAWGKSGYGDSVPNDIAALTDIVEVISTWRAFAARRNNGHVVAWGDSSWGGQVPQQIAVLGDIVQVAGSAGAFAALRTNGSVVAWGDSAFGGDTTPVASNLHDVCAIYANRSSFAALTTDGRTVTWGDAKSGGDSSSAQSILASSLRYAAP